MVCSRRRVRLANKFGNSSSTRRSVRSAAVTLPRSLPTIVCAKKPQYTQTPHTLLDAPHARLDTPHTLLDIPHTLLDTPRTLLGTPHTFLDSPHALLDTPRTLLDTKTRLSNSKSSPTVTVPLNTVRLLLETWTLPNVTPKPVLLGHTRFHPNPKANMASMPSETTRNHESPSEMWNNTITTSSKARRNRRSPRVPWNNTVGMSIKAKATGDHSLPWNNTISMSINASPRTVVPTSSKDPQSNEAPTHPPRPLAHPHCADQIGNHLPTYTPRPTPHLQRTCNPDNRSPLRSMAHTHHRNDPDNTPPMHNSNTLHATAVIPTRSSPSTQVPRHPKGRLPVEASRYPGAHLPATAEAPSRVIPTQFENPRPMHSLRRHPGGCPIAHVSGICNCGNGQEYRPSPDSVGLTNKSVAGDHRRNKKNLGPLARMKKILGEVSEKVLRKKESDESFACVTARDVERCGK